LADKGIVFACFHIGIDILKDFNSHIDNLIPVINIILTDKPAERGMDIPNVLVLWNRSLY
jgi:hypothetical protein